MKKFLAIGLALALVLGLTACGTGGASGGSSDGEVSVFYYTYGDAYISSVRSSMSKLLEKAGVEVEYFPKEELLGIFDTIR